MSATARLPSDDAIARFERRFDRSFLRVYAFVFARVNDHRTTQRLTRDVLTRSLPEILDDDEHELDVVLLRAAKQLLRAELARREPPR